MWGTFEKRLTIGGLALGWMGWMVIHCAWQMWVHWPQRPENAVRTRPLPLHRARHIAAAFFPEVAASFPAARDQSNPFFPNPSQPPPAPPPVVTRQVEIVYQGYYATSQGEKRAFVMSGGQLFSGPPGTAVVAGFAIGEITSAAITLVHPDGRRISLDFRVPKSIEVPL